MKNIMADKQILRIDSYSEFEKHLRECVQWNSNVGQYDLIGIGGLFSAIISNLSTRIHEHELDLLKEILTNKDVEFLKKITN